MIKKYKLILGQHTFLWIKNNEELIYNSENYQKFFFTLSSKLSKLCLYLLDIDNLYTVELTEDELMSEDVRRFF